MADNTIDFTLSGLSDADLDAALERFSDSAEIEAESQAEEQAAEDRRAIEQLGLNADELEDFLRSRPDVDELLGAPTTAGDVARNARVAAELKRGQDAATALSGLAKDEAVSAAWAELGDAEDDETLFAALDRLSAKVGIGDPRMAEFLSELATEDPTGASQWLQRAQRQVDEAEAAQTGFQQVEAVAARAKHAEIQAAAHSKTVAALTKEHGADVVGRAQELLREFGAVNFETAADARKALEQAIAGVRELAAVEKDEAFDADFWRAIHPGLIDGGREGRWDDEETGSFVPPRTAAREIDESRIALRVPSKQRTDEFMRQLDAHFDRAPGLRDEIDRKAVRAEKRAAKAKRK